MPSHAFVISYGRLQRLVEQLHANSTPPDQPILLAQVQDMEDMEDGVYALKTELGYFDAYDFDRNNDTSLCPREHSDHITTFKLDGPTIVTNIVNHKSDQCRGAQRQITYNTHATYINKFANSTLERMKVSIRRRKLDNSPWPVKHNAQALDGQVIWVRRGWIIDDGEGRDDYKGEVAYIIDTDRLPPHMPDWRDLPLWLPSGDLIPVNTDNEPSTIAVINNPPLPGKFTVSTQGHVDQTIVDAILQPMLRHVRYESDIQMSYIAHQLSLAGHCVVTWTPDPSSSITVIVTDPAPGNEIVATVATDLTPGEASTMPATEEHDDSYARVKVPEFPRPGSALGPFVYPYATCPAAYEVKLYEDGCFACHHGKQYGVCNTLGPVAVFLGVTFDDEQAAHELCNQMNTAFLAGYRYHHQLFKGA
jgi:hypothetical protein